MGLHKFPSDLDIFFFFAITEYLSVTGDWDFLHHSVPFYPKNSTDLPPGNIINYKILNDHYDYYYYYYYYY